MARKTRSRFTLVVFLCIALAPAARFAVAAGEETLGQPQAEPSQSQLDRAFRLGEQFWQQMPSNVPYPTTPLGPIPQAYITPTPEDRREAYYVPCYNYCRRYPFTTYCRPPGICAPYPVKRGYRDNKTRHR